MAMSIEQAMAMIRRPEILSDDSKLRAILASIFDAGRASVPHQVSDRDHGMIAFNDGTVVSILWQYPRRRQSSSTQTVHWTRRCRDYFGMRSVVPEKAG